MGSRELFSLIISYSAEEREFAMKLSMSTIV